MEKGQKEQRRRKKGRRTFAAYIMLLVMTISLIPVFLAKEGGIAEAGEASTVKSIQVNAAVRYDYAYEVLKLVNLERAKVGAKPLVMDRVLMEAALQRAAENVLVFAATETISHDRPDGTAFWYVSEKTQAENLACGQTDPESVVKAWMESTQGHKETLLGSEYVCVGIGVLQVDDSVELYWTQEFGRDTPEALDCPVNCVRTFTVKTTSELYNAVAADPTGSEIFVTGTWKKSKGGWWYRYPDGTYPKKEWLLLKGVWYYFDPSGYMVTGWQKIGGKWYYFNDSGAMKTGWLSLSGKWYFLNPSGVMVTGWKKIGGSWYYFGGGGVMKTGWMLSGGKWYYFKSSGAMVTGTAKVGGKAYSFDNNGVCLNP